MKKLQFYFLFFWIISAVLYAQDKNSCEQIILEIHPTQISVGMLEVKQKEADIEEIQNHSKDLQDYLKKHAIPAVRGPGKQIYMVDHHHLALALYHRGIQKVCCQILADYRHLSQDAFWNQMGSKNWVYPDYLGQRYPVTALPKDVLGLKDDPYRSLAGAVRDAGGYSKTTVPFAEFQWANFLRAHIPAQLVETDFKTAVKQGVELAQSETAHQAVLPGYHGVPELLSLRAEEF